MKLDKSLNHRFYKIRKNGVRIREYLINAALEGKLGGT